MKKLLSTLLFVPALALADSGIVKFEAYCVSLDKLSEILNKHKEEPMLTFVSFRGIEKNSEKKYPAVMFVNPKTHSYTIAEQVDDNLYCVTSVGSGATPYMPKEDKSKM